MNFLSDLAIFYADFGVDVTLTRLAGGATVPGLAIFDQPGVEVIGGEVLATDYTVRFQRATFGAVLRGDTFLIAGALYTVREQAQPLADALESVAPLSRSGL